MSESQLAVLRLMADGQCRASWKINESLYGKTDHVINQICRPAVELKNVGMLSRISGLYGITEFGRVALSWFDGGGR